MALHKSYQEGRTEKKKRFLFLNLSFTKWNNKTVQHQETIEFTQILKGHNRGNLPILLLYLKTTWILSNIFYLH